MNNQKPMIGKQPVTVNLDTMPDVKCGAKLRDQVFRQDSKSKCESVEFTKVFQFKKLSAIVSPTGKEQVVQLEFLKCLACGAVKVIK